MTDLKLDEDFYVIFDETNDLGTVSDYEAFTQDLAQSVTGFFFNHIGDRNTSNVERKLKMQAKRAAEQNDYVDSVQNIDVKTQEGDSIYLTINFNVNEEFTFEVI